MLVFCRCSVVLLADILAEFTAAFPMTSLPGLFCLACFDPSLFQCRASSECRAVVSGLGRGIHPTAFEGVERGLPAAPRDRSDGGAPVVVVFRTAICGSLSHDQGWFSLRAKDTASWFRLVANIAT